MIEYLAIGVGTAVFFFCFYMFFFRKTSEREFEEIRKALEKGSKPPISTTKGMLLTCTILSIGAGLGAGLTYWAITLLF